MGFACPVCETPQADLEHLANHLAITAMLGRDDHAAWLDDHDPEWADRSPEALGAAIEDDVEAVETESTTGETSGERAHDHDEPRPGDLFDDESGTGIEHSGRERGAANGEASQILEEAREMTERMVQDTAESDEDEDENE